MKTQTSNLSLLFYFTMLVLVFVLCGSSSLNTKKFGSMSQDANSSYNKNDSLGILKLHVKVISDIGIGWGVIHNCEIISIDEGGLPEIDSMIVLYISVGSRFYSYEDPVLKTGHDYIISFFRNSKSEKSYMPAGTTGFMDKQGYVWLINTITEKEDTQGQFALYYDFNMNDYELFLKRTYGDSARVVRENLRADIFNNVLFDTTWVRFMNTVELDSVRCITDKEIESYNSWSFNINSEYNALYRDIMETGGFVIFTLRGERILIAVIMEEMLAGVPPFPQLRGVWAMGNSKSLNLSLMGASDLYSKESEDLLSGQYKKFEQIKAYFKSIGKYKE